MQSMFIANDNRAQLARQTSQAFERRKGAQGPLLEDKLFGMADPYAKERDQVIRDPGGALNDSPFFKFMQEKYLNATKAKNTAGGFTNSGRGLMALGEASQKASADYLFPYLQSLGRPGQGADAYLQGYKITNNIGGGGGVVRSAPRSLSSMGGMSVPGALPYTGQPAAPTKQGFYDPSVLAGTTLDGRSPGGQFGDPRTMTLAQLTAEMEAGGY